MSQQGGSTARAFERLVDNARKTWSHTTLASICLKVSGFNICEALILFGKACNWDQNRELWKHETARLCSEVAHERGYLSVFLKTFNQKEEGVQGCLEKVCNLP